MNESEDIYNFDLPPKPSKLAAIGDFVLDLIKVGIISLVIILPVRYFLVQPFYVKGASMEPNFYDHEYLIIDEISYRLTQPRRGEIVVFKYPKDPKQYFIKRIVGLPGERLRINGGQVEIAGPGEEYRILTENYLDSGTKTNLPVRGYGEVKLADNEYFLLGDNRDESLDSRIFGPINKDFFIGRTWLRGWPITRLTIFNTPNY